MLFKSIGLNCTVDAQSLKIQEWGSLGFLGKFLLRGLLGVARKYSELHLKKQVFQTYPFSTLPFPLCASKVLIL